jgi:hypothetical protein
LNLKALVKDLARELGITERHLEKLADVVRKDVPYLTEKRSIWKS